MNKRDLVLSLLDADREPAYIPAAFFLHFDPQFHQGQAAVEKHLEYFRSTGMDFVKIQYEKVFPPIQELRDPEDWSKMPFYGPEFFADQIDIARGLVEAAGEEALVLMTLYSPFMCAGHTVGKEVLTRHLMEDPEKVTKGLEIITDSLMVFVKGCIASGVDGFYHSTQGGETSRFEGSPVFDRYIKPYDLALMNEIERNCRFNILHVCDYVDGYTDLTPFLDYPGHVVNCSLKLGSETITGEGVSRLFGRPFMGGLDRHGIITSGSAVEIKAAVDHICEEAPKSFILGADCTLPGDLDWQRIKTAIDTAHSFTR